MSKNYHLYQVNGVDQVRAIEAQVMGLDGIEAVSISEDFGSMSISAKDDCFTQVMDRVVNICRHVAPDSEVTYMF